MIKYVYVTGAERLRRLRANEVKPTEAEQAECEKRRAEHDDPRRK